MQMEQVDVTIVLPTYNESQNVKTLLQQIKDSLQKTRRSYEVLFVDDSNDDTPEVIKGLMNEHGSVRLIHRSENERTGLATAFIKGFDDARGRYICCMDSDLQHSPKKIIVLLEEIISEDSDIVVASRYTRGGSAMGLDGMYRKAISLGVSYFVQILFPQTRKTSDPGSGFFIFKKGILNGVELRPQGFKILIEILARARYSKVTQIPYTFLPRKNDESKATLSQGVRFLKHLWSIFLTSPEAARFIKFCIVGTSGVVVNLGLLYMFVDILHFENNISWTVAVLVSIANNFTWNSLFTYSDRRSATYRQSIKRLGQYYLISLSIMGFNLFIYKLGLHWELHYIYAAFIGICISTIINFILVMKIVWKEDVVENRNAKLVAQRKF